jgi:hypothetical protein
LRTKSEKAPPFGGTFRLNIWMNVNPQLAALIGHLALTARILLLLTGLLATALLLAGLLTRGLVLLTRILVRIAHSDTPLLVFTPRQPAPAALVAGNSAVPMRSFRGSRLTGS